jgi:hypothetical protein
MSVLFNENSFTLIYYVYLSILFSNFLCFYKMCDFSNINKVIFLGDDFSLFFKEKIEKFFFNFSSKSICAFSAKNLHFREIQN